MWVQAPIGGTVLRIKTMGKIRVSKCDASPNTHADMVVQDDIRICVANDEVRKR